MQFQCRATLTVPLTGCTLCLSRHFHFLLHVCYIFPSSSLLNRCLCLLTVSIPSQLELAFGFLAVLTSLETMRPSCEVTPQPRFCVV